MNRLDESQLRGLSTRDVQLPRYNRDKLQIRIVHLGIGAFHRAHQALYTEKLLNKGDLNWGIAGVSLRRPDVRDQLMPQDGLYTSKVVNSDQFSLQVVGAVRKVLVAPEDPAAVVAQLADPAVVVVTLTITEKGYLDSSPGSAADYLCRALAERMRQGSAGMTIISCDNLSGNGGKLSALVVARAKETDEKLADWIELNCSFPETMVDRIVPATTDLDRNSIAEALGLRDEAAIVSESFCQWVIEENFAGPVPPWNSVGAQFVENVAPYELMKLRLLNASHSAIAYLGCLANCGTVAEAISVSALHQFVERLMREEVQPVLEIPENFDVAKYQTELLARFGNTSLHHKTQQIAMDGSQKIPQRLLPTLAEQLDRDGPIDRLVLVLAAWMLYVRGDGINDPLADKFLELRSESDDDIALWMENVLGLTEIFQPQLAANSRFRDALLRALQSLLDKGVLQTLSS
jgi:fructuronate reductase